ncbi:MAG: hypothetical protein LH632_14770 [Rhodoferax sp.]|nr:hypothetical protein [Rhodoferax sp.]
MPNRNLAAATTDLIESYGNTAKNVINAYRVGGERVIGFMDQRWERALEKNSSRLSAEVRGNALSAQKTLSGYYARGINLTTNGADALVGKAVELAAKGVQQAAANASQFEKKTGLTTLQNVAAAAVPAVDAVQKIASSIEQRSGRLVNRIAGRKAAVKVAAAKRVTPFKRARARKSA